MSFETFLEEAPLILTEGSVYERLRRHPSLEYDPFLAHASLLYDTSDRDMLERVHREYLEVGQRYGLPMIALTDTWRASRERIQRSRFHDLPVNQDHAHFLCALGAEYTSPSTPVFVGGLLACRGDAYRPDEALSSDDAASFHAYQAEALAETDVDFLMASTLPAFSEAHGMARAMASTHRPYLLSFVLRPDGTLLDGTPLRQMIEEIDATVTRPPTGYLINCVHPSILNQAMRTGSLAEPLFARRILGLQANTSAKSPEELDGLATLETEEPASFASLMWALHQQYGLRILGGCCGTDTRHIERLAFLGSESNKGLIKR